MARRTRLIGRQSTLWPEWRHLAFLADQEGSAVEVDAFHRAHANVALTIKDLKEGEGMEHVSSGNFNANAAWLMCAALAHNLIRWTAVLGEITPKDHFIVARNVRTRYLSVPGRLVTISGTPRLLAPLKYREPRSSNEASNSCVPFHPPRCHRSASDRCTADD